MTQFLVFIVAPVSIFLAWVLILWRAQFTAPYHAPTYYRQYDPPGRLPVYTGFRGGSRMDGPLVSERCPDFVPEWMEDEDA